MSTTIRVKRETLRKLARVIGELTSKLGRRVSYDEAIAYLVDQYYEGEVGSDEGTLKLLELFKKSFKVGGPEDLREYDYSDVGE